MIRSLLGLSLAVLIFGCAPAVGDTCEVNTDCGRELVCDTSQPEGYCTRSPCEPGTCPSEGVCIAFDDGSHFCMKRCEKSDDCRDGYVCVDNFGDAPFCNSAPYLGK